MPDHERDSDDGEQFDLEIRVPGVAFDIGQPGFPRVLVMQRVANRVDEYDDARDGKGQADYLKNALVRTQPDDAVFQAVYLPDGPIGGQDLNDPNTRYPVPESRLVPLRAERATPIDDSPEWTPREAVALDVLKDLFDTARAYADAPDMDDLHQLVVHTALNPEVTDAAREHVEAAGYGNVPDDMEMGEVTELDVDDEDGPDMELKRVGEGDEDGPDMELKRVGEGDEEPDMTPVGGDSPDEATDEDVADAVGDPPDPPEDGGPDNVDELDDDELGDFDPSDDV